MRQASAPGWLWAALVASAAVIAAAPGVGHINAWLRASAGGQYVHLLGAALAAAVLATMAAAWLSIRTERWVRFGWMASALALAVGYGVAAGSGDAATDAVERFHFLQYGSLAVLFYMAYRPAGDASVLLMPLLWGVLVGSAEEWCQWFVPVRVGEAKDVLLNLVAVTAGLLFALGVAPPRRITMTLAPDSRRRVLLVAAAALVTFAGFFHAVHLGHEIADPAGAVFRSRYTASELAAVSEARRQQWQRHPPLTWSRYSREDQYLTEGVAHVRRRNQRWDEGRLLAARQENLILERHYAPVLDTPSFLSATGHRWPAAQREHAEQLPGPGFMIYESDALTYLVVTWPPGVYWTVVLAVALLLMRAAAWRGHAPVSGRSGP